MRRRSRGWETELTDPGPGWRVRVRVWPMEHEILDSAIVILLGYLLLPAAATVMPCASDIM